MSDYLWHVGAKLARLGVAAVNAAIPVAVAATIEKANELIEAKLRQLYKITIRNSAITLAINTAGILILIFHPFGKRAATWISMIFFAAAFIFWLVRVILYCKRYGKTTVSGIKNVIEKRSLSKGISKSIVENYPRITWVYAGINLASNKFSALKEIPRLNELVKIFIQNFWKRIALFAGIVTFYTITVYWIIKPILIKIYF